jgi:hypothetical protein
MTKDGVTSWEEGGLYYLRLRKGKTEVTATISFAEVCRLGPGQLEAYVLEVCGRRFSPEQMEQLKAFIEKGRAMVWNSSSQAEPSSTPASELAAAGLGVASSAAPSPRPSSATGRSLGASAERVTGPSAPGAGGKSRGGTSAPPAPRSQTPGN